MLPDQFLERLEDVARQSDTQFNARCPAHDDDHASLSVALQPDRLLVHCHAGCTPTQIVETWGGTLGDLFYDQPTNGNGNGSGPVRLPKPQPQHVSPARQSCTAPKASMPPQVVIDSWRKRITEISDRLHDVKGWTLPTLNKLGVGWDGTRIVFTVYDHTGTLVGLSRYLPGGTKPKTYAVGERNLFPAPETLEGPGLWLVEGEPDAVTATELGIPAVAVPGVGKWRDDWAYRFHGRTVTVCMDADPEGRECAVKRANALDQAGVNVAIVDICPDRADGTDLGDLHAYARATGRINDLRAHLRGLHDEAWKVPR